MKYFYCRVHIFSKHIFSQQEVKAKILARRREVRFEVDLGIIRIIRLNNIYIVSAPQKSWRHPTANIFKLGKTCGYRTNVEYLTPKISKGGIRRGGGFNECWILGIAARASPEPGGVPGCASPGRRIAFATKTFKKGVTFVFATKTFKNGVTFIFATKTFKNGFTFIFATKTFRKWNPQV